VGFVTFWAGHNRQRDHQSRHPMAAAARRI